MCNLIPRQEQRVKVSGVLEQTSIPLKSKSRETGSSLISRLQTRACQELNIGCKKLVVRRLAYQESCKISEVDSLGTILKASCNKF